MRLGPETETDLDRMVSQKKKVTIVHRDIRLGISLCLSLRLALLPLARLLRLLSAPGRFLLLCRRFLLLLWGRDRGQAKERCLPRYVLLLLRLPFAPACAALALVRLGGVNLVEEALALVQVLVRVCAAREGITAVGVRTCCRLPRKGIAAYRTSNVLANVRKCEYRTEGTYEVGWYRPWPTQTHRPRAASHQNLSQASGPRARARHLRVVSGPRATATSSRPACCLRMTSR